LQINPRLVYCSISGFGASGPYAERPSYDSVAQALSGFLSVVVDYRRPQFLGPALADAITGLYASQGILAALVQRGRSARGGHVEVSMLEAMAHFAVEPFAAFFALGQTPTSADRPRLAQAYILRTADERLIAIHLSSLEKFWQGLVQALEAPELARDPRFATRAGRIEEYEALRIELDAHFSRRTLDEWMHRLEAHDVPHAPVNRIDEVVHDPQVEHLGVIVPVEAPHGAARSPARLRARELWRIPEPYLAEAQDDATVLAIRAQEEAVLDIITDGEIRRESYSNRFATALDGIDLDNPGTALDRSGHPNPVPRVVGPIRRRHAVGVGDAQFLRRHTRRLIKATVPGPFTMAQQAQIDYYGGSRERAAMDYAVAVNAEVRDLFSAGADI